MARPHSVPEPLLSGGHVDDEELLYHSVREEYFARQSPSAVTISANAYNDRGMKPSVDRALLNAFEPQRTRFRESDAIVCLVASAVRDIRNVVQTADGVPGAPYQIDVIPRPVAADLTNGIAANPAHAQIESAPELTSSAFKRLKSVLAAMSQVELDPYEQVVYITRNGQVFHRSMCPCVKRGGHPVAFHNVPPVARPCRRCRPDG